MTTMRYQSNKQQIIGTRKYTKNYFDRIDSITFSEHTIFSIFFFFLVDVVNVLVVLQILSNMQKHTHIHTRSHTHTPGQRRNNYII